MHYIRSTHISIHMQRVSWGYLHATFFSRSSNAVARLADHSYLQLHSNAKKLCSKQVFFQKITFFFMSPTQTTHTQSSTYSTFKLLYIGKLREHGYHRESSRQLLNSLPGFAESPIGDAKASVLCVDEGSKGKDSLVCQIFFRRSLGCLFSVGLVFLGVESTGANSLNISRRQWTKPETADLPSIADCGWT